MPSSRSWRQAADAFHADSRAVVDTRLRSPAACQAHGLPGDAAVPAGDLRRDGHVHTRFVVDRFSYDDLARLAPPAAAWAKRGPAVPLFLASGELRRSADAFPLELGRLTARRMVVATVETLRLFRGGGESWWTMERTMRQPTQSKVVRFSLTSCLVAIALPLAGCSYSQFVAMEEAIMARWVQVGQQLQRRNDSIPNMLAGVKGCATQRDGATGATTSGR